MRKLVCNYNRLVKFLEKKLDIDQRLEILSHLETCSDCFDELYKLRRMKDSKHFIYKAFDEAEGFNNIAG